MSVVGAITTVVTLASKATGALSSGVTIYEKVSKSDPLSTGEKVQVGVESVFCVLQILEFGVFSTSKIAPNFSAKLCGSSQNVEITNLSARIATGTLDVARTITQKTLKDNFGIEDLVDLVAVVVFRASDVASHLHGCETLCENKKPIQYTTAALDTVASGVMVYRSRDKLCKATRFIINLLQERPHPVQGSRPPVVPVFIPGGQNAEDLEREHEEFLRSVIDWKNLHAIPSLLDRDQGLALFTCSITKRPVRYPLRAKNQDGKIIYEKAELEELLNTTQNPPPGWPNDLPFTAQNIEVEEDTQFYIEKRLQILAEQFKQEL